MDSIFQDIRLEILSCKTVRLETQPGLRPVTPYWRLHWSASGKSKVFLGKCEYKLGPDKILLVPPHVEIGRELDTPSIHFFTHFTMLSKGLKKLKKAYIFNLSEEKNGELKELLEFAKRDKWSYGELLKLNAFILSFPAKIPECDWSGKISDFRISKLLKIIERDPATTHSNEKLARQIGMSVNAFIRFFKQRTGFAPLSYQIRQRLEKAMILLEHTEKTIEEIAEECGFCDRNYFSKTFKEHTGTPPAQYRKESVE